MEVVCAWCKKDLGTKEPLEDTSVTHEMCQECYEEKTNEMPKVPDSNEA